MRIMIVEDEVDNAATLAMLVRLHGYEPHVCLYAPDCMGTVESLRPDVVLVDLAMPKMTGFDIAEEFRENPDLRPRLLVAVTGFAGEENRRRSLAAGFDYHLEKPIKPAELFAILSQAAHTSVRPIAPETPPSSPNIDQGPAMFLFR